MGKASAWQWRPVKSFTHANVLRLLIGVWILNAPFLREELASSDQTFWNQLIVGSCVVVLAAMRMVFAREAGIFRWAHLLLGVWLIASPWIFAYVDEQAAFWNSAVSGALIAALALWSLVR
ncbi:MAG TPA: SPW repeat protein [Steroidobacteraceae bacterium]|nr:SPW repeat protein [Steroidobacteraceae bacterium]